MKKIALYITGFIALVFLIYSIHPNGNYDEFKAFNASKIDGLIQQVGSRSKSVGFVITNNLGVVYYFHQDYSVQLNYPDFRYVAEVGDSISKEPNSDHLYLFKFGSHKKYDYPVRMKVH
jgi:hypothetical protein